MFEALKDYKRILVTGPQRSGTRIAAKMIAADTGYEYIDETEFGVHSRKGLRNLLCRSYIVVHCPALCRTIVNYSDEETMIVLMRRSIEDIIASEKRIGWEFGALDELWKYGVAYNELRREAAEGIPISIRKYEYWEKEQKDRLFNSLELEYETLSAHSLWLPKETRADFAPEQTE